MKKKVLICGASGFIGRNIFERLSKREDFDVYGTYLNNQSFSGSPLTPNSKLWRVDFTDRNSAIKLTAGFDCIIHAAALTYGLGAVKTDPVTYIAHNIVMNTNIAEAMRINNIPHLIFMSCSVVYANSPQPQTEEEVDLDFVHPQYFMGARIKISMEDLCNFYSRHCNSRFTMIRHSNIYGPYDKFDLEKGHVFAATIKKVVSAKDNGEIVIWGKGKEKRDFLYVSDLVDFIEIIVSGKFIIGEFTPQFNVLNVGSETGISVSELVEKIVKISGKNIKIRYDPSKPSLRNCIILDCKKAWEMTGWQPKVDLDQGIRQTIDWLIGNENYGI